METVIEQIRNNELPDVMRPMQELLDLDWNEIFTEIGRTGNLDILPEVKKCYKFAYNNKKWNDNIFYVNINENIKFGAIENDNLDMLQKFVDETNNYEYGYIHYKAGKFGARKCCEWLNDSDYAWLEQNEAMMCGAADGNHLDICEMIKCRQCDNKWVIALISATIYDNTELYEYAFERCFKDEKNIKSDYCTLYGLLQYKCNGVYNDIGNFDEKTSTLKSLVDNYFNFEKK